MFMTHPHLFTLTGLGKREHQGSNQRRAISTMLIVLLVLLVFCPCNGLLPLLVNKGHGNSHLFEGRAEGNKSEQFALGEALRTLTYPFPDALASRKGMQSFGSHSQGRSPKGVARAKRRKRRTNKTLPLHCL